MWSSAVSPALSGNNTLLLADICLAQARQQKTEEKFEAALGWYDQAKVIFKGVAAAHRAALSLSPLKDALRAARTPQTPEEDALRKNIAEVYFERAKVLIKLGNHEKARTSYQKAVIWGHLEAENELNHFLETSGSAPTGRRADAHHRLTQRLVNIPVPPALYVPRAQAASLLKLLKDHSNALIEVTGLPGVGKTTLVQHLIHQNPNGFLDAYDLVAWIDCSSVSRAHADIQAIAQALGHTGQDPKAALRTLADYGRKHPNALLILDALAPDDADPVLAWLKLWPGQLITTTTQVLTGSLSTTLGRPGVSVPIGPFDSDQAKQLVQQHLPKEDLASVDFTPFLQLSGGLPGVMAALCQYFEAAIVRFKDFADFLSQQTRHQTLQDPLLGQIAQACLSPLETEAEQNPLAARALARLKQAVWLGDHRVPFAFFVDENQNLDEAAIQFLHTKKLAILAIDRQTQSLKLSGAFLGVLQQRYQAEQTRWVTQNIERLTEVFSYLTDNDSPGGRRCQPKDLSPYTDLVHTLLFETLPHVSLPEDKGLLHQRLALGSSLARLYYLHHGELKLAHECLQKAQKGFKHGLSKDVIAVFEEKPEDFTRPTVSAEERALLKLYAQEYLYQQATLASQLVPRGQIAPEIIQNFERSVHIQRNLGSEGDPESIAYTLRNLTRALRKQGRLIDALDEYDALKDWIDQHPDVFDERSAAELLVDQGIIQKEWEDAKPEGERNYQGAIDTLLETQHVYLKHEQSSRPALSVLSIYLGEATLSAGDFEASLTHTFRILHYDPQSRWKQARAYFNLAKAFHAAGYLALAKCTVDKALPLQIDAYQATTEALRLKIEQGLLQRHQTSSSGPTATGQDLETLKTDCEATLLSSSQPPKTLTLSDIETAESALYAGFRRQHSKESLEVEKAKLNQQQADLEAQEKAQADKQALQKAQDDAWYRSFAQRIDLSAPENRNAGIFAHQFKEALLHQIVQKIRLANGEDMPMGKTDLAEGLIQAVSGALPQITVSAGVVQGTIDLPAIVQGVTQTLADRHRQNKQSGAQRVSEFVRQQPMESAQDVCTRIKQQIQTMAHYAARCYQPVLCNIEALQDIQTLADTGVKRVMETLKTGKPHTLSDQELVILALMTGKANTRLHQPKTGERTLPLKETLSVNGFFGKPGIQVDTEEGQAPKRYLSSNKARPRVYGWRYGSLFEVRTRPYQGPFDHEDETHGAEDQSRCEVM